MKDTKGAHAGSPIKARCPGPLNTPSQLYYKEWVESCWSLGWSVAHGTGVVTHSLPVNDNLTTSIYEAFAVSLGTYTKLQLVTEKNLQ